MSTEDIQREQQIADEALEAWKETAFRYLDARYGAELPWSDAVPAGNGEVQQQREGRGGRGGAARGLDPKLTALTAGTCVHDSEADAASAITGCGGKVPAPFDGVTDNNQQQEEGTQQ